MEKTIAVNKRQSFISCIRDSKEIFWEGILGKTGKKRVSLVDGRKRFEEDVE